MLSLRYTWYVFRTPRCGHDFVDRIEFDSAFIGIEDEMGFIKKTPYAVVLKCNNNNKIFIAVSMYLAHRANWGHLLLQN